MAEQAAVEAAFRVIEAPDPATIPVSSWAVEQIVEPVKQQINEKHAREALEQMRDPGKRYTVADAEARYKELTATAGDTLDGDGNPESSGDQKDRLEKGEKVLKRNAEIAEKGFKEYEKTHPDEADEVKKELADYFKNHDGFLAAKGLDPTDLDPENQKKIEEEAKKFAEGLLTNPSFQHELANWLRDPMKLKTIDYSNLHALLKQQQELEKKIEAHNKDDIEKTLDEAKEELTKYEVRGEIEWDTSVSPPKITGIKPVMGEEGAKRVVLEEDIKSLNNQLEQINRDLALIKEYAKQEDKGSIRSITVRDAGGNPITIENPRHYSNFIQNHSDVALQEKRDSLVSIKERYHEEVAKINDEERKIKEKVDEKQKKLDSYDEDHAALTSQKEKVETKLESEKIAIVSKEDARNTDIDNAISNVSTDLWMDAVELAEKQLTEQGANLPSIKSEIYTKAREQLREDLYDDKKKKFNKEKLKKLVDDLVKDGLQKYGEDQIEALKTRWTDHGSDEEKALIPLLDEMKGNADECIKFAQEKAGEGIALAAIKNPGALKNLFTSDDALMRKLNGDVLPEWIASIKDKPGMTEKIEGILGKGVVRDEQRLKERFKNLSWHDLSRLLLLLAGGTVALLVKSH